MNWILIVAGVVLLISPLNTRYRHRKIRRRIVERGGDVERFDQYLHSRSLQALYYVFFPAVGVPVIVLGL